MDLALPLVVVAPVAHLDVSMIGLDPGRRNDLLDGALEGVAVVGVALQSPRRQDPATFGAYGEGDFAAELVSPVRLALRDALHLRGMDAVELALVAALLQMEPSSEGE
jgi:hypothetical protein